MMGNLRENIKTLNSVVRTAAVVLVLAAFAYGGFLTYTNYIRPGFEAREAKLKLEQAAVALADLRSQIDQHNQEIERQRAMIQELNLRNEQLALANKLIKVDHRLARIHVIAKGIDDDTGERFIDVDFYEVDDSGKRLADPMRYRLRGEKLYLDAFIVKFDDQFIESADALRSTSMYMFKRIFGEDDGLAGGYSLDMDTQGNMRAAAYTQESAVSEFERRIWREFWAISNDPVKQREYGIRNNHGQINYIDPLPGQVYEFTLRSSDGLSFNVLGDTARAH